MASTAFPRGGSLKLTSGTSGAESGALFAVNGVTKKRRDPKKRKNDNFASVEGEIIKRQRQKEAARDNDGPLETTTRAHALSVKRLNDGTRALGVVQTVGRDSAQLALPGGITAYLPKQMLSDVHAAGRGESMDKYLKPGQLVPCLLRRETTEGEGGRSRTRVVASMRMSDLSSKDAVANIAVGDPAYGCVQSAEDHGYVVTFGHDDVVTGFLKYEIAGGDMDEPALLPGQLVKARVVSLSGGAATASKKGKKGKKQAVGGRAVAQLDNRPEQVMGSVTRRDCSIEGLQPGMLVKGTTLKYVKDGLVIALMGIFVGTVDRFHLGTWNIDPSLKMDLDDMQGKDVLASVLFVDPETKSIALSCEPRIVARTAKLEARDALLFSKATGRNFSKCLVRRIDARAGVLLEVDPEAARETLGEGLDDVNGGDDTPLLVYARRSRMDKEHRAASLGFDLDEIEQLDKKYKVGQETPCRVLAHNPIDGILHVSLSQSVIESSALVLDEVCPGSHTKAKVVKVTDHSVIAALSDSIRAVVPSLHLSDVKVTDPQSRFKVGQTLSCRVLSKDLSDPLKPRVALTNKRSLVQSTLPPLVDLAEVKPGLVTHGVVTSSTAEKGVFVSFYNNLFGPIDKKDLMQLGVTDPAEVYKVGSVIKVRVVKCNPSKGRLRLSVLALDGEEKDGRSEIPDGTLVSGKVTKRDKAHLVVKLKDGVVMSLPVAHLSDNLERAKHLLKTRYKKGAAVEGAMVLSSTEGILTLKPALLAAQREGTLASEADEIKAQTTCVGFVRNVTHAGVFVGFLGETTAFCPRANVADQFVTDPSELVKVGQTVACAVAEEQRAGERPLVSLKASQLELPAFAQRAYLESFGFCGGEQAGPRTGQVLKLTVTGVDEEGATLKTTDTDVVGFCPKEHFADSGAPEKGASVDCVVLDTHSSTGQLEVSLREKLVKGASLPEKKAAKAIKAVKGKTAATVELVRAGFVVVSLPEHQSLLAVAPVQSFNGPLAGAPRLVPGAACEVVPLAGERVPGVLLSALHISTAARSSGSGSGYQVTVGAKVHGKSRGAFGCQLNVSLPGATCPDAFPDVDRLYGHLHASQVACDVEALVRERKSVFQDLAEGASVAAEVASLTKRDTPGTGGKSVLDVHLTQKPDAMEVDGASLELGATCIGFVDRISEDSVRVSLSPAVHGYVYCAQVSRDLELLGKIFNENDHSALPVGAPVRLTLLSRVGKSLEFSMLD